MMPELSKRVFDDEVEYFRRQLHKTILHGMLRDGNLSGLKTTPERMAALLYAMVNELAMAAAATNLIVGDTEGTDLVMAMTGVLSAGIQNRTLQLRHACDEMEEVYGQANADATAAGDRRQ